MEVHVSFKHISQGDKQNNLRNPIALALQEFDRFAVCTSIHAHLVRGIATLPAKAASWLERYNAGRDVSAFSFTLEF